MGQARVRQNGFIIGNMALFYIWAAPEREIWVTMESEQFRLNITFCLKNLRLAL